MPSWTTKDIPSQSGKTAIVTGVGGLGYETALELARADAAVVLAGRNEARGLKAVSDIVTALGEEARTRVRFSKLDLANLASVKAFAQRTLDETNALHLLVNNAGVMATPRRGTTADGFELQLGTNYLGHFALTGLLLPALRAAGSSRVVNVSSIAHRNGRIDFDDLQSQKRYAPWTAYGQSKLAMILFALELQRRSNRGGWGISSNAAHPGFARTELIANGPGASSLQGALSKILSKLVGHSAAEGARPILFAATSEQASGGEYYGPQGAFELKGPPGPALMKPQALDPVLSRRLFDESERMTGVVFEAKAEAARASSPRARP